MKTEILIATTFLIGTSCLFASEKTNDFFIPPQNKDSKVQQTSEKFVQSKTDKFTYGIKLKTNDSKEKNLSHEELREKLKIAAIKNYIYIQPEIVRKE